MALITMARMSSPASPLAQTLESSQIPVLVIRGFNGKAVLFFIFLFVQFHYFYFSSAYSMLYRLVRDVLYGDLGKEKYDCYSWPVHH